MPFRQFGGRVTDSLKNRYQQSPNWSDGKFQNLQDTSMSISLKDFPKILYQQLSGRSDRTPNKPLPIKSFDHQKLMDTSEKMMYAWYGHSAIFMKLNGLNILIDPMLGPDASPIGPITTQRFSKDSLDLIDDFPEIDLLLMTHDHYDHLDFESIKKLKNKTKRYFVALGLKRHLVSWGVDSALITEFDWWEEYELGGVKVTFTPTRHFSGRGLTDRAKCLWGGWAFQTAAESIWFSGDGGYGQHFQKIGEHFGGFDFAFMECGQYNEHWRQIHLFPDESVFAAQDAFAKKIMPVHWAGFTLAPHHWKEPVEIFTTTAKSRQMDFVIPQIGELRSVEETHWEEWWREY